MQSCSRRKSQIWRVTTGNANYCCNNRKASLLNVGW
jgi:hypothetical protein